MGTITVEILWDGFKFLVSPARAFVGLQEQVNWLVRYKARATSDLRWTIYFRHGTPFPDCPDFFELSAVVSGDNMPTTLIEGPVAVREGEWKYGVRVEDKRTGTKLDDDDPYLIVGQSSQEGTAAGRAGRA